jgi:hypothetical protein
MTRRIIIVTDKPRDAVASLAITSFHVTNGCGVLENGDEFLVVHPASLERIIGMVYDELRILCPVLERTPGLNAALARIGRV